MTLGKPVLIVDGFAGPGRFGNGDAGSPLIIAQAIASTLAKDLKRRVPVSLLCIEADASLFSQLRHNLAPFPFADARHGTFGDTSAEIAKHSQSQTVFLYVDPFTVEGLDWNQLSGVFQGLRAGQSVEVLMNFNVFSFLRRGLAALSLLDAAEEDGDPVDLPLHLEPTVEKLNSVVGGEWWQALLASSDSTATKVDSLSDRLCQRLRHWFTYVCRHSIKEHPSHLIPKYDLIFGSRHPDALLLMNDEMIKSRRVLADMAKPPEPTLFELRSEELVPDLDRLPGLIRQEAKTPITRGALILLLIRSRFCEFHTTEIRGVISRMLKTGEMKAEGGKTRINDETSVWSAE